MEKNRFLSLTLRIAFTLMLVSVAVLSGPQQQAQAQGGLTYSSGFQVQNQGNAPANITLSFYNQSDGNLLGTTSVTPAIPVGGSRTFFPITLPGGATTFNGSLVISSDQPIAAINNLVDSTGTYVDTTRSFSSGSTSFSLPLIMCNNGGFNTFFNVQNVGSSDANITITYIPGSSGNSGLTDQATIKPGAAKTFDQAVGSSTRNCSTLGSGAGQRFVGSAVISSNEPVVAAVMQLNTTNFKNLIGYNGFASGSSSIAVPLIMANNSTYYTGIQVQNVGSTTCNNVTITYSANTAGANNPVADSFNLSANASQTIIQNGVGSQSGVNNWNTIGRYVGSATISGSGCSLVAIVNQVSAVVGPSGAAYTGFDPSAATGTVNAPLIMANNSGYYTGIQVQNAGSTTCNNVTVTYGANTVVNTNTPTADVFNLDANTSRTIIQNGVGSQSGTNNWTAFGRYVGSAVITGSGCSLVAIVNQVAPSRPGDTFSAYNAFNQ